MLFRLELWSISVAHIPSNQDLKLSFEDDEQCQNIFFLCRLFQVFFANISCEIVSEPQEFFHQGLQPDLKRKRLLRKLVD